MEKDSDVSTAGSSSNTMSSGAVGSSTVASSSGLTTNLSDPSNSHTKPTDSLFPSGGELLILIVDCNPLWWNSIAKPSAGVDPFIHVWQCLLGLCNAHCMMEPDNELLITAVTPPGRTTVLFSSADDIDRSHSFLNESSIRDGMCEKLSFTNDLVRRRLIEVVEEFNKKIVNQTGGGVDHLDNSIVNREFRVSNALSKALCYYGRRYRETQPLRGAEDPMDILTQTAGSGLKKTVFSHLQARVMIVRGSKDNANQYMHLMNGVFTAQKMHVALDVCHLIPPDVVAAHQNLTGNPSLSSNQPPTTSSCTGGNLLQQAVKLTGGMYVPVSKWDGFLQFLLTLFLPRSSGLRSALVLSPGSALAVAIRAGLISAQVDFRAACFCHRRLVDIGYVCSVCLSIFCAFSPFCTTCYAHFKLPAGTGQSAASLSGSGGGSSAGGVGGGIVGGGGGGSVGSSGTSSVTSKRRKKGA